MSIDKMPALPYSPNNENPDEEELTPQRRALRQVLAAAGVRLSKLGADAIRAVVKKVYDSEIDNYRARKLVSPVLRKMLIKRGKFSEDQVRRFVQIKMHLDAASGAGTTNAKESLPKEDAVLLARIEEFIKMRQRFKKGFAAGVAVGTAVGAGAILDGDEVSEEDTKELGDEGRVVRSIKKNPDRSSPEVPTSKNTAPPVGERFKAAPDTNSRFKPDTKTPGNRFKAR